MKFSTNPDLRSIPFNSTGVSSMEFRVISYNIHRAIGVDRRFMPERIARIIAHHDPDIVLLQEVDVGVPRSRKLDLAEELATIMDYPHYAVGLLFAVTRRADAFCGWASLYG